MSMPAGPAVAEGIRAVLIEEDRNSHRIPATLGEDTVGVAGRCCTAGDDDPALAAVPAAERTDA